MNREPQFMGLLSVVEQDLNTALKARDTLKVSVLRLLKSALNYKQIDKGSELTDEEVVTIIDKEVKKRHESIVAFRGKRDDLADKEQQELEILEKYLPQSLSESEIESVVQEVLSQQPEGTQFGAIMGAVMRQLQGKRVDGNLVREIVMKRTTAGS